MALTIRHVSEEQIKMAKDLTGKATASAAIVDCITLAQGYKNMATDLQDDCKRLQLEVKKLMSILHGARSAAAVLVDSTSQADLLRG